MDHTNATVVQLTNRIGAQRDAIRALIAEFGDPVVHKIAWTPKGRALRVRVGEIADLRREIRGLTYQVACRQAHDRSPLTFGDAVRVLPAFMMDGPPHHDDVTGLIGVVTRFDPDEIHIGEAAIARGYDYIPAGRVVAV